MSLRRVRHATLAALLLLLTAAVLAAVGCGPGAPAPSVAYWPTEGWRTSTPEEQGMDSELLAGAVDYLMGQDGYNIHSLLVIRNGYIVADAYFYPFAEGSLHDVASVTKSVTSTLVGIAIAQGYISGVDQTVLSLFPERMAANLDADKEAMTVEDLLTMRSGLTCIAEPAEITLFAMQAEPDWVQFTLDLPMSEAPGTRFVYCGPNCHLLSAMIKETTGLTALDFAEENLFGPLGFSDVIWPAGPLGNNHGWGDLLLTPHDMARLGFLYLQEGLWDGEQVLSPEWVEAATHAPQDAESPNYGYLWWLGTHPVVGEHYRADGRGGQYIYVCPEMEMMIVITGGGGTNMPAVRDEFLTSYVIPAVKSDGPLAANPDGVASLQSALAQAAAPPSVEPEPVPPLPDMAEQVSGRTYTVDDNMFDVRSFSLAFSEENEAVFTYGSAQAGEEYEVELLVGLDGIDRIAPGRYGLPAAARGRWESDDTFVIRMNEIGNINTWQIRAAFEGDGVTVEMVEVGTGLGAATFGGIAEE